MLRKHARATAVALACCVSLTPIAHAAQGAASVDALWKELSAMSKPEDTPRLLALIHPDDRALLGFSLFFAGAMTPLAFLDDDAKAKKVSAAWDALVKKHGIHKVENAAPGEVTPEAVATNARRVFATVDLAAFARDAIHFIQTNAGQPELLPWPKGKLERLEVDGAAATATVGGGPVRFSQVDGRWYLRMQ